jgi:hypothetical protein
MYASVSSKHPFQPLGRFASVMPQKGVTSVSARLGTPRFGETTASFDMANITAKETFGNTASGQSVQEPWATHTLMHVPQEKPKHVNPLLASSIQSIQTVQPEAPDRLLRGKHLARNLTSTYHAWHKVANGQASNDYDLANSSDTMQRASTLGIATLGGLASGSKVSMIDFFVGTAAWLGMMSAVPIAVDWLVKVRTGFNTAGRYMASYPVGDNNRKAIKPIALDPNYIPLAGIPKPDLDKLQRKVVAPDEENPGDALKHYTHQIASQRNALLATVAGSTPVFASIFADRISPKVQKLLAQFQDAQLKRQWKEVIKYEQGTSNLTSRAVSLAYHRIDRAVGDHPDSQLTRWWQRLMKPSWPVGWWRATKDPSKLALTHYLDVKPAWKMSWLTPWKPKLILPQGKLLDEKILFGPQSTVWRAVVDTLMTLSPTKRETLAGYLAHKDLTLVALQRDNAEILFHTGKQLRQNSQKKLEKLVQQLGLTSEEETQWLTTLGKMLEKKTLLPSGGRYYQSWRFDLHAFEQHLQNLKQMVKEPDQKLWVEQLIHHMVIDPHKQSFGGLVDAESLLSRRVMNARATIAHLQNILTLIHHKPQVESLLRLDRPEQFQSLLQQSSEGVSLNQIKHLTDTHQSESLERVLGGWVKHFPFIEGKRLGQLERDLEARGKSFPSAILSRMDDDRLFKAGTMQFSQAFERLGKNPVQLIQESLQETWVTQRWKGSMYSLAAMATAFSAMYVALAMRPPKRQQTASDDKPQSSLPISSQFGISVSSGNVMNTQLQKEAT